MSTELPKAAAVKVFQTARKWTPYLRRPVASACMLPDYIIPGAQKSGTTSLWRYMLQHPDILRPALNKELHYFDLNFRHSAQWYRAHYPFRREGKVTGEKSPYYLYHPCVPRRVHEFDPSLKLIILLRDPVKRAYSHYHHEIENERETRAFRQAVEQELEAVERDHERLARGEIDRSERHQRYSYVARGRYAEQLDRWLEYFPREQIYLDTAERFFRNPVTVCQEVFEFIGVEPFEPSTERKHNPGKYDPISDADRQWLAQLYREPNSDLARRHGVDISAWT